MKRILIGISISLSSFASFASDANFSGELLLGNTKQNIQGDSYSDKSVGIKGIYNVNPNVGIELSFMKYGEPNSSTMIYDNLELRRADFTFSSNAINLGIKGILPLQYNFSVNARIGISFWNFSYDTFTNNYSSPDISDSDSFSGKDLYYGFGGQYKFNEKFNIGIEYTLSKFGLDSVDAFVINETLSLTTGMYF